MNTNSRCKRNTARRYQKNRIRLMYALRQPHMSIAHLDGTDLLFSMCTPYVQPRTVMQGSHYIPKD